MKSAQLIAIWTCCLIAYINGQRSDNYGYKPPQPAFRPPSRVTPTTRPPPPPRPAQTYGPPSTRPPIRPTTRPPPTRPPPTYGPPSQNIYQSSSNLIPSAQIPSQQYPGMPYDFQWGIDDNQSGNSYSHTETSDGKTTQGQYQVLLPDGRLQIVKFFDNGGGYQAEVTYQ